MAVAGRAIPLIKGDYNPGTPYTFLDLVYYGGSTWIAKRAVTGITPANGDDWQLFAKGYLATDFNDLTNKPTTIAGYGITDAYTKEEADKTGNWLRGKKINFISDSIGVVGSPTYPVLVGQILGCTINNYGISGDRLSGTSGINARVLNMDTDAVVNVILGGTNDYTWNVPLGDITSTDNTTVYGALNVMCNNLVATYPNAINVLMTPLKRSKAPDAGTVSYPLRSIANAICEIGKKYNMNVIDLYNSAPNFNPNIAGLSGRWESDGLHPNSSYISTFLGNKIARNLLSLESSGNGPDFQTYAFTPESILTGTAYKLEKDINKMVSFSFSGTIDIPIGTTTIGTISGECSPQRISLITCGANNPIAPITGWVDMSGSVKIASTSAISATTLYGTGAYRAKN